MVTNIGVSVTTIWQLLYNTPTAEWTALVVLRARVQFTAKTGIKEQYLSPDAPIHLAVNRYPGVKKLLHNYFLF